MPAPFRRMWVLLAAVALAVVSIAPAAAHTDLLSSDPEDGQTLAAPPERVTLRFGQDLLTAGAQIVAKDDTGVKVGLGPAEVSGSRVSATWPGTADGGAYTVSWRAVAADGHPLEGRFTFTVVAEQVSAPASQAPVQEPSPVASPVASEQDQGGSGFNPLLPAVFIVLVAAVGLFVWRSRGD
jgi:methionine-rich copper-binding protein CopC